MHYYQFNIADYRKDTIHLSRVEHSIYRDLIDWYYLEETPIPKETQSVIRRLRLVSDSDISALQNVLKDFFCLSDDGFRHKRIDFEIREYHEKCETNRTNGIKGGRPKGKKTQSVSSRLPVASQTDATANPNHKPVTSNHKPSNTGGVPVQSVIDLYHAALPELPTVLLLPKKRKEAIGKFIDFVLTSKKTDGTPRATNEAEALEWIDAYFHRVRDNAFLMGKIGRVGEHAGWKCDLDYLLTDRGMTQVIEKTREAA